MPPPDARDAAPLARAQRLLGTMAATVLGLSAIAIIALFVTRAAGTPGSAYRSGILQFVAVFPTPGLAIGLALVIALIAVSVVQRARSERR